MESIGIQQYILVIAIKWPYSLYHKRYSNCHSTAIATDFPIDSLDLSPTAKVGPYSEDALLLAGDVSHVTCKDYGADVESVDGGCAMVKRWIQP